MMKDGMTTPYIQSYIAIYKLAENSLPLYVCEWP